LSGVTDSQSSQTDAPSPSITIRAGGPLDGVVTITAIADGRGRTLIEASWAQDGQPSSDSVEDETYDAAGEIAHTIANQLAARNTPRPHTRLTALN
jgi:hypothetical protein